MAETNIYEKLRKVQLELKAPKNQRNSFGGYTYRSAEDIIEAAKPVLDKQGLTLVVTDELIHFASTHPSEQVDLVDSKGNKSTQWVGGDRFYVKASAMVTDGGLDSAERVNIIASHAYAREDDFKKGMDGAQITGAASSYARKYALNGLLAIDDTKDADSDEHTAQRTQKAPTKPTEELMTDAQKVQIKSFLIASGVRDTAEQKKYLYETFGVTPDQITKTKAVEILEALK